MPYKDIEARRAKNQRWRAANPGYYAEYRKQNKEQVSASSQKHKDLHPEKFEARDRVNRKVKHGHWPKPSFFACTDCGVRAKEYHHEDYSLWWSVLPLCKKCHGIRHRARKPPA